ncbi:hypothetical protein [Nocardioides sambongensis]|uniref:hypothetical protein n=1 Tax=Nocardioides sambongensis TaxID=2589074 RepID=UPI00112996E7|nr:hypothetical protein [Nocardioides sambongensis]
MADGDELKVNAALLRALDLDPDEGGEPSLTLILAACIQQLAVECGLVEREDDRFSWVAHAIPGEPLRVLTDVICDTDSELTDDVVRDWLYDGLLGISEDSVARKSLNKSSAVSRDEVLAFSQVYWNLEADGRRTELPIRSGQKLANGLMARIKDPNADIDLACLDLKNRAAPAGFPKGGGAYYARGARIAVLIADRVTRNNWTPPDGQARLRSTQTGRGAEWSIVWPTREHVDTHRPSRNDVAPVTPAGLTSRARARHVVDSLEQDMRYAIERFVPDELSPTEIFGPLYDKLMARRASVDAPDAEALTAYLHPQESRDVLLRHVDALPPDLVESLRSAVTSFDDFIPVRNRIVRGRPLQPDDLDETEAFVERFRSPQFPLTTAALQQLATDAGWQPKARAGSGPLDLVLNNLPEADFDETGLLGREQLVTEVVAMVKRRRYPIMLRGEGGIGKTALALEVAYRLLDDPESPFDAILWTSLKTEQLTTAGIRDLSNALRDVAGVATAIGTAVDRTFRGGIEELGAAIGEMKTLIVVDNLETLHGDEFFALDDALSDRDVTFLLTSRVGTGDRTQTRDVGPLDEASATQLFRNFARSSGSYDLSEWTAEKISTTLRDLRYSPLAIRWYILSVAAGKPVSDPLRNQDELLRFCVGNVVEALGDEETLLLQVLRVVDRPISFDELAVISEIDIDALRRGAQRLTQRSLLVRTQAPNGDDSELLSLSSTARSFLPPVPESGVLEDVYRREREYNQDRALEAQWIADRGRYFDPNLIFERSTSDGPVAHLLHRALRESKTGNPTAAAATLDRARAINPGYFEVDRVEAFFASTSGRTVAATALFRSALSKCESEEERCWVGYFYSAHLARAVRDIPAAIDIAEATHNYFTTYDTAHHLGNFYFWNNQFTQGKQLIEWALEHAPTAEFKRKATTSLVKCLQQWSDADLANNSPADALANALRAVSVGLELHDSGSTDDKLVRAVNGALVSALKAARRAAELSPEDERALAHAVTRANDDTRLRQNDSWGFVEFTLATLTPEMREKVAPGVSVAHVDFAPRERLRGTVVNVRQKYGFIAHPHFPENIFFQAGWLQPPTEMADLSAGSPVHFTPSRNDKGQDQARNVMLVEQDVEGVPADRPSRQPRSASPQVEDDETLTAVVDDVRRIFGEFTRPAKLLEVSTLLARALGDDAKQARDKFRSFKAFLEYAVPSAQIVTDPRHGRVVLPEGVPPDQPLPDTWFSTPLIDDDPELTATVANEALRIISELSRPAKLPEVSALLTRSLGDEAKRTWTKYKTFEAFLAYAVPSAQILPDPRHGRVVLPEGVSPDQPLPDTWFSTPLIDDNPELTATVANEARRIISELSRPAKLPEVSALLTRSLGEDAKRTWTKHKGFDAFLEYAVPSAQIVTDPLHGRVILPEGTRPDQQLTDTLFAGPLIDDDPELTATVANEARRIISELSRPAKLPEVSALLTRSLGDEAKRTWTKYKTFEAFLAYAVPSAQILPDPRHGRVVLPEGVPPDQPLPDTWFSTPLIDDNPELTATVANEARRIISELSRPAKLPEVSALLTRSLGEDAKRTWTKHKGFDAFLEYAVPSAQIVTDPLHGRVILPEGTRPDQQLTDTLFAGPLIDDDPELTATVANEARRIISELSRPAKLPEVSALLTRSLGDEAKRTWTKYKTFEAFLAYAVPSAQILPDPRHGRVVLPEGVPPDQPLPDTWFSTPLIDDNPELTATVANEARRIISELSRPATLPEVSTGLIKALGPDAKQAWAKYKTFKVFLANAVPSAQIVPDPRHGFVIIPEAVAADNSHSDPSSNG